jgi:hypothetical protein
MTRTHKYKKYYKGGRRTQKNRRRSALLKKRKSLKGGTTFTTVKKALDTSKQLAQHVKGLYHSDEDFKAVVDVAGQVASNRLGLTKSSKSDPTHSTVPAHSIGDSSELLAEIKQLKTRIDEEGKKTQRQLDETLTELKKTKEDAMHDRIEKDPNYRKILEVLLRVSDQ